MDQAFNSRFDFDERPKISKSGDGATNALARLVFASNRIPRMRLKLLHADCNAVLFRINLDNFGFDLLPRRKNIGGLGNASPRNFTDMKQRIRASDVDERAIGGQAAT